MRLPLLSGLTLLLVLLEQRDSVLLRENTGEGTGSVLSPGTLTQSCTGL